MVKYPKTLFLIAVIVILIAIFGAQLYQSVPAGHVAVATLFGNVRPKPYKEGLHLPVNPLYDWYFFDVRKKSHLESANVPSQDQLQIPRPNQFLWILTAPIALFDLGHGQIKI